MATLREMDLVVDAANADELARLQFGVADLPNHQIVAVDGLTITIRVAPHEIAVP